VRGRPRVLVLGASGWVGASVVAALRTVWDVAAPGHADVDVADRGAVSRGITSTGCAAVLNLAAANPPADEATMERVNAVGAGRVAEAARDAGVRLVHVSTDLVHDGCSPPYADDAPARPLNAYGRSKAAGEAAVRRVLPGALVVRTSLVVDPAAPDRFTRSVIDRLARGETAALFVDEVRCPIARGTLAAALAELLARSDVGGTLNVAGTQPISRHDLALRLLRRFGVGRLDLLRPARAADAAAVAGPRPLDLTLDVSRAISLLSTPLRSIDEELTRASPPGA